MGWGSALAAGASTHWGIVDPGNMISYHRNTDWEFDPWPTKSHVLVLQKETLAGYQHGVRTPLLLRVERPHAGKWFPRTIQYIPKMRNGGSERISYPQQTMGRGLTLQETQRRYNWWQRSGIILSSSRMRRGRLITIQTITIGGIGETLFITHLICI
jgi:hypothetical protein